MPPLETSEGPRGARVVAREAGGTCGAVVRKPSAEVAAKAEGRGAAGDSQGRTAEQRGTTESQDRDAIEDGSLLKIVSHGIAFEVDCDHSQLTVCGVAVSRCSLNLFAFTWRLRAFTARSPGLWRMRPRYYRLHCIGDRYTPPELDPRIMNMAMQPRTLGQR
jgi:hypothetical protein